MLRYHRTLQAEIEYLSRLIDDLFELSQIDAGLLSLNLERASLGDLVSDSLAGLSPEAQRHGLVLRGQVDAAIPPILVDAKRLQRVLYNLVQNALRYTPADGSVVIRVEDAGPEVRVCVADTGRGIAPEDMPRLFEGLHKGDRARSRTNGGSGLGLSIAKGIVEAHGGRIWAESTPGKGSAFFFTLPKRVEPQASQA
jgi:signal transduction histidine kinase